MSILQNRPRRGLSYLEVLIASGIALTGILALLALFPVAILNLQKGQITDNIAAIGPSALRSGRAVGVTDSSNWLAYNAGAWTASNFLQTRPLPANLPAQPGAWHSLCFDPRFAASLPPAVAGSFSPGHFPFTPPILGNVNDVRMARVTLRAAPGTAIPGPMSTAQARNIFKVPDDLIFERPPDATVPAQQLLIQRSDLAEVRRNYMADYEYVITMTPNLRGIPVGYVAPNNPSSPPISYLFGGAPFAPERMPMDPPSEYTMSAVVFYKRQVDLSEYVPGDRNEPEAERVTDVVNFYNSGFNGGDITIRARSTVNGNELEVHQGDWVLLSGNMYTQSVPRKFMGPLFQWYRVASVNGETYGAGLRDLTLDGPDWPVNLMAPLGSPGGVQLSIISGVVGVFSTQVQVK